MIFYKNTQGQVFAYESELDRDNYGTPDLVRMTTQEVNEHSNPSTSTLTIADLRSAVTAKRWKVETGGITLPSGMRVATGTEDQNRITSVIANAARAGVESVDFKSANGWVSLTIEQLEDIASAIALHVQACFSAERSHYAAIDSHTGDLSKYDINTGWPE